MTGPALIERRAFLKMAGAAWAIGLAERQAFALSRTDAVFASAFRAPDGTYGIATVAEDGTIIERSPLPARAHGMSFCRATGRIAAFARRPGTYVLIRFADGREAPIVATAAEGRHFYGHGSFSADGRLLYATENDFANRTGMVGVYDTADGTRKGEFPSYGVGPHDMTLSADSRVLIIANGGIETHPDFGRTKLNLGRMEPSLVLVDTASGSLIEKHVLPDNLKALSTRHVDIDGQGGIWFACQYEGPRNDLPPLVGRFAPGDALSFVELPEPVTDSLANYVGAIAVNRHEGLVGITSPKGGMSVMIDAKTKRYLRSDLVIEAAGVAAARSGFAVSSYGGHFGNTLSPVAWDQHIIRLG